MFKRTQTIRQQQPTNCLSVFDHFVVLVLKGLVLRQREKHNIKVTRDFNLLMSSFHWKVMHT